MVEAFHYDAFFFINSISSEILHLFNKILKYFDKMPISGLHNLKILREKTLWRK